jgi:hypothetical protein
MTECGRASAELGGEPAAFEELRQRQQPNRTAATGQQWAHQGASRALLGTRRAETN